MLITSYDPFTFMIIVILTIFSLCGVIVIIFYNVLHAPNTNQNTSSNTIPNTTMQCIPQPTPLKNNQFF